ncbi:MAG TPA: DUF799 family lipoprotein [Elusimicrobiota bacterium]|nr:DUF799 family lipoprotein [Elusimicrobiota bacterium]
MNKRLMIAGIILTSLLPACLPPRLVIKEHVEANEVLELAIFPFQDAGFPGIGDRVADLFSTELLKLPQYNIIEKGLVENRIKNRGLTSQRVDTEQALEIAGELGADAVLIGEVTSYSPRKYWLFPPAEAAVNARLIDVKTGHIVWSAYHRRNYGLAHWITTLLPFPPTMALSLLYSPAVENRTEQTVQNIVSSLNREFMRYERRQGVGRKKTGEK